jgi:hypothetical protein
MGDFIMSKIIFNEPQKRLLEANSNVASVSDRAHLISKSKRSKKS